MRICLFTCSLQRGGAERVFVNLANHWVGEGHTVDFVVFNPEGGFRDALGESVRVIDFSRMRSCLPMRFDAIRLFARYLRENSPDQVFATLTYANMTALWAAKVACYRGRIVVRQANSIHNQGNNSAFVRLWNWIGYRLCYSWADTVLVNSENSEQEMLNLIPRVRKRLKLLYNPVLLPDNDCSQCGYPKAEVPQILASGRFVLQKDYPTLLRAFRKVLDERPARLIILGDGPLRGAIKTLIEELRLGESVELAGYVSDPDAYYASADVFVLTSRWEGFPNVVAEALAWGLPTVVTDCKGASREIVAPILPANVVPVGDSDQIAERIIASFACPVKGEELQRYIHERFSLPVVARHYLDIA